MLRTEESVGVKDRPVKGLGWGCAQKESAVAQERSGEREEKDC